MNSGPKKKMALAFIDFLLKKGFFIYSLLTLTVVFVIIYMIDILCKVLDYLSEGQRVERNMRTERAGNPDAARRVSAPTDVDAAV